MTTDETGSSTLHRARRASSSRNQACLPPAPTPRPHAKFPGAESYIWRGSAETQNMHQETIKLDIFWLPNEDRYLYAIEFQKPVKATVIREIENR